MKLKLVVENSLRLNEVVQCITWASLEEAVTASDDHHIYICNVNTLQKTPILGLPETLFPVSLEWMPQISSGTSGKRVAFAGLFALSSTDGSFYLINKSGRIEKTVEAHKGAVLALKWSYDANSFATCGEDGQVKLWSRNGMLRSTLTQNSVSVYSLAWGPNSAQIAHTLGKSLVIRSIRANVQALTWKAHDGIILKVDWNPVNDLVISGGEDCKYKIWDSFGRLLFVSQPSEHPTTSLSWSRDGQFFAVGSYNSLRLCDKIGWSHTIVKPETGSLSDIDWSVDGTQIAASGANGQIIFAKLIEWKNEWDDLEVVVKDERMITVLNISDGAVETLEFRDRVLKTSLYFGYFLVITANQCHIYSVKNFNTPTITELKGTNISLVVQCESLFLLVDSDGYSVYNYEGRSVSTLKQPFLRTELVYLSVVALSNDTIAAKDTDDEKVVHLFDAVPAKTVGDGKPITHSVDVLEIGLNQRDSPMDRLLVLLDKNKELFLYQVRMYGRSRAATKLGGMVSTFLWSETDNVLVALQNDKLTIFYYPSIALIDKEILDLTVQERDTLEDCGKFARLENFRGNRITVRRAEGSIINFPVFPYPAVLYRYASKNKWPEVIALCRSAKDNLLWACLAGMAIAAKKLDIAELAYAAIDKPDKVEHIRRVLAMPTTEARNAQMLLLAGQPREAECVLLQAGLNFSAIMLNLTSYNWERALELSSKNEEAKLIVSSTRQHYLSQLRRQEFLRSFSNCQVHNLLSIEALEQAIVSEYEKEVSAK